MREVAPLVGMHYRPPAKAILAGLAGGANLILRLEPENPYDPNAIMVLVKGDETEPDARASVGILAEGYGFSLEQIVEAAEPWHIGYLARERAAELAPRIAARLPLGALEWEGTLSFDHTGKPQVALELPA